MFKRSRPWDNDKNDGKKQKTVPCVQPPEKDIAAFLKAGIDALNGKDYQGAIRNLTYVLNDKLDNQTALLKRAEAYLFLKNYKQAENDITALLKLASFPDSNHLRGLAILNLCIDAKQNIDELTQKAYEYYQQKNYQATIEQCTRVMELDPQNKKIIVVRADCYYHLKNYEAAEQDCDNISPIVLTALSPLTVMIKMANTGPTAHNFSLDLQEVFRIKKQCLQAKQLIEQNLSAASALLARAQYKEAAEKYAVVLDLDPVHKKALLEQAICCFELRDLKTAEENCKQALTLSLTPKQNEDALILLGFIYQKQGDYKQAEECWNMLFSHIPTPSFRAFYGRGISYFYAQKYQESIADFDAALQIVPTEKIIHFKRSKSLVRLAEQKNKQIQTLQNECQRMDYYLQNFLVSGKKQQIKELQAQVRALRQEAKQIRFHFMNAAMAGNTSQQEKEDQLYEIIDLFNDEGNYKDSETVILNLKQVNELRGALCLNTVHFKQNKHPETAVKNLLQCLENKNMNAEEYLFTLKFFFEHQLLKEAKSACLVIDSKKDTLFENTSPNLLKMYHGYKQRILTTLLSSPLYHSAVKQRLVDVEIITEAPVRANVGFSSV
ncbi:tetratricopeptide repeat protein [Legionella septentrionalis]|uniref:tetratricopeptide repeat protein n=1 Tax=Legionella septentrionalis TaxID=2498109 RepID=UPI000F8CC7A8|nr:tetratricopeptide repeat protein [Legionella septentrionalis]RUR08801.1 tetratricopeptide repeat protein [Legionella septentrionalis]